ncbi:MULTISPECIES: glycosyltransferase [unclassified Sphingomonas]|uniref:glycosyltransferase n=1 Tax=unclassified Sphingomonas TaxID=196159 RepID=UPI0007000B70|nr:MULTISPECIES: glycosyltransferase [unclassified Sphingomonas]KQM24599.1 hypothetical protein ASE58_14335 [Sphingomonas sp. Leaf9]KQM42258.1 hypothetical protein ASE57_14340 [Sphingomonas sp. Leaf11]
MILVTVGTQLPFDRLIRAVDAIAPQFDVPFFAQIGQGAYQPENMRWGATIPPSEFDDMMRDARLIVSHAGTGTFLTARRFGKPVVLFPRRAAFGEHRNDHQMATIGRLADIPGVIGAMDEADLAPALRQGLEQDMPAVSEDSDQRDAFLHALSDFMQTGKLAKAPS